MTPKHLDEHVPVDFTFGFWGPFKHYADTGLTIHLVERRPAPSHRADNEAEAIDQ